MFIGFRQGNFNTSMTSFINNQPNITNLPFESTSVQYSSKHNGLYLFVSRLLRPLWNIKAVNMETTDGKTYVIYYYSNLHFNTIIIVKFLFLDS